MLDVIGGRAHVADRERERVDAVVEVVFRGDAAEARHHRHHTVRHRFARRDRHALPRREVQQHVELGINVIVELLGGLPAEEVDVGKAAAQLRLLRAGAGDDAGERHAAPAQLVERIGEIERALLQRGDAADVA